MYYCMYVYALYICMYHILCVCLPMPLRAHLKIKTQNCFRASSYHCRRPRRRPLRRPLSWRSAPMRRHRPPQMQQLPKRQRCIPKWPRARRIRVSATSSSLAARKATMTTTRRRCPFGVSRSSRSR